MNTKLPACTLLGALALCACIACPTIMAQGQGRAREIRPNRIRPPYPHPQIANVGVEILKEGVPAVMYLDSGYRWIEGRRGERFAFRITNHNPFPVGAIPSADGHSLTADGRASANHPAYVINPFESLTVSVWREDLAGGRELVFTDVDQSLAALKGDRRNIGVLGVLVWQLEDRERPVPMDRYGRQRDGSASSPAKAPGAGGGSVAGAAREDRAAPQDPGIGVGAGERVSDRAYLTDRYRRVRVLGTVAIYYDDRPGLLRAGVNLNPYREPYPQPDRRQAEPFPDFPNDAYPGVHVPR